MNKKIWDQRGESAWWLKFLIFVLKCSMLHWLNWIDFFVYILKGFVKILAFGYKFSTHFHILCLKEVIKLGLKVFDDPFDSVFNFLTSLFISLLNLFLEREHFHHEFIIMDAGRVLDLYASEFHHINGATKVIEQSRFGLIDVGWVFDHFIFEDVFHILVGRVFIRMILFLKFLGLHWYDFLVYFVLFGTDIIMCEYMLKILK